VLTVAMAAEHMDIGSENCESASPPTTSSSCQDAASSAATFPDCWTAEQYAYFSIAWDRL